MSKAETSHTTAAMNGALTTASAAGAAFLDAPRRDDHELTSLAAMLRRANAAHSAAVLHYSDAEGTAAEASAARSVSASFAASEAVVRRMAAVPALCATGMAVKAARLAYAVMEGATAADAALAASAARDAARLTS